MEEYKSEFSGKQIDEAVGWAQTNRSVNLQELQKEVSRKQEALRTGNGIKLKDNVISVDDSVPTLEDLTKEESERMAADLLRPTQSEVDAMLATAKELLFRDMWNLACNAQCYGVRNQEQYYLGRYNEETGFYECNGITDLTYEEALMIFNYRRPLQADMVRAYAYISNGRMGAKLRTNLFTNTISPYTTATNITYVAYYCQDMEVLRLGYPEWTTQALTLSASTSAMFSSCKSLKKIIGVIDMGNFTTTTTLYPFGTASDNGANATKAIEEFQFSNIQCNMSMVNQPNITCESILYMIENRKGTNAITFIVHADVYNRCLDYEVEGYNNLQDYALDKNITIGIV